MKFTYPMMLAAVAVALPAPILIAAPAAAAPFVKVCNNGAPAGGSGCPANPALGPAPGQWGCTLDKATMLLWEVKTPSTPRLFSGVYTNYDSTALPQMPGGKQPTLADINAKTNSVGYRNAVNGMSLCRRQTWAIPTFTQLNSIVRPGASPAIDTMFFPEMTWGLLPAFPTLSATPTPGSVVNYNGITFTNGKLLSWQRSKGSFIRLVSCWTKPCGVVSADGDIENPG